MPSKKQTQLNVNGMTCQSCVQRVSEALEEIDGVYSVSVMLRDGKAVVIHDPVKAPTDQLLSAIDVAGYDARPG